MYKEPLDPFFFLFPEELSLVVTGTALLLALRRGTGDFPLEAAFSLTYTLKRCRNSFFLFTSNALPSPVSMPLVFVIFFWILFLCCVFLFFFCRCQSLLSVLSPLFVVFLTSGVFFTRPSRRLRSRFFLLLETDHEPLCHLSFP